MIDLDAFCNAKLTKEISDVGNGKSEYNPADALTKVILSVSLSQILKGNQRDFAIFIGLYNIDATTHPLSKLWECDKLYLCV